MCCVTSFSSVLFFFALVFVCIYNIYIYIYIYIYITRKNLSVCYTDLKTNQVLFFWTTPSSEITKTFGLFPFINMQKQSPSAGFELAIFSLRLTWNTSSLLTAPLTPQKNIWLRSYTWLGNTRILRPI